MPWSFWTVDNEEDFNVSAQNWFRITITFASLGFLFFILSGFVVLAQPDVDAKQKTSQTFAPFLIGIVALVTFCAAIWRGKLNSEQIRQQKRQNDAKDDENIAKLMMDGAKLLDEDKDSHVLAGIAALQAVVVTPSTKFSTHAMDVLADFIIERMADTSKVRTSDAARKALNMGATAGMISSRTVEVKALDPEDTHENYNGFRRIRYSSGWITSEIYESLMNIKNVSFIDVKIDECTLKEKLGSFDKCEFFGCRFETIRLTQIKRNSFHDCDFSGTKFTTFSKVGKISQRDVPKLVALKNNNCFFKTANPPTGLDIQNWQDYLLEKTD